MQDLQELLRGLSPRYSSQVLAGPEMLRVAALPRCEPVSDAYCEAVSRALRLRPVGPDGEPNLLRPVQVQALRELVEYRCLAAPIPVGGGKTLISLLATTVLQCERPVLVLPAQLRKKTLRDFALLRHDWRVRLPKIVTYQELGHPNNASRLTLLRPDLLIFDEAHYARNTNAACSRRIFRAVREVQPTPIRAVLSGTLDTDKLMDSHDLYTLAMGDRSPIAIPKAEAERWANAVDVTVTTLDRIAPGALGELPGGYHAWKRGSRGVVVPDGKTDVTAALEIYPWVPEMPPELVTMLEHVTLTGLRPDGELLSEWELSDCLCSLALGFWSLWDPAPPDWWMRPRRNWNSYARDVLGQHLPDYDSESTITRALAHPYRSLPRPCPEHMHGQELLAKWRAVKDLFTPNPVAQWVTPQILDQAAAWARQHKGIVWSKYVAPGSRLDADYGIKYYGEDSLPETHPHKTPMVCSIPAHHMGRNLQGWDRMLVLHPPGKEDRWEQLIGRCHRSGQRSDAVHVHVIQSIDYHKKALAYAKNSAIVTQHVHHTPRKLAIATWV